MKRISEGMNLTQAKCCGGRCCGQAIEYFDRYKGRTEKEAVYGDNFLKWAYGTCLGQVSVEIACKRGWFSKLYGVLMRMGGSKRKIDGFIKKYEVKMDSFEVPEGGFRSFNDFFIRKLQSGARLIDQDAGSVVFPADARHMGFQNASEIDGVFAKGQRFSVGELVGDETLGERYKEGSIIISRLCPVDYHRFHFPVDGKIKGTRLINGYLYSVNPVALRKNLGIFWENKRWITEIESESFGKVLMLEIGATCVGSVVETYKGEHIQKGNEKGYFQFGGSSVILLFEKGRVQLAQDLLRESQKGRELYAHMGDILGTRA